MKKTPIVFEMDYEKERVTPQVRPGQEWVLAGEGIATIKFDGQACLWQDGKLWKRFDRKLNKQAQRRLDHGQALGPLNDGLFRNAPEGFVPCEAAPDPVTFHWPGWVPVSETDPADKWHREALAGLTQAMEEGQTYELVGPTLALNVYGLERHELWKHGNDTVELMDRSLEALERFLTEHNVEGLVFHHPDGRKAKIRRKDFQLFWVQEDTRRRKPTRKPM